MPALTPVSRSHHGEHAPRPASLSVAGPHGRPRSPRGRPIGRGLTILLAVIGFTRPLGATPFIPENDAVVLERLPTSLGDSPGELRGLRDQLAREPTDVALAVALAGRYIELGQGQSDPRYYGYAQAALAPWWGLPDPPPEVLFLRAAIRQSRHEFDAALQDLSRLLETDPRDPQAWLMQAVIFIVRADYQAARQACEALARLRRAFLAFSCMGSLASLSGQAQGGYDLLRLAQAKSQNATLGERVRNRDAARQDRRTSGRLGARRGPFPGGAEAKPPRCLSPRGLRGFPPRPRARGRSGRVTPRRDAGRWPAPAPDPGRARDRRAGDGGPHGRLAGALCGEPAARR